APVASKAAFLLNLRNRVPALARAAEGRTGFSAQRKLPEWSRDPYRGAAPNGAASEKEAVLFVDTFNRWFEPENSRAAERVLGAAGYAVATPGEGRPLCCGRTFLSVGLVEEAKAEARRTIASLLPYTRRGVKIVGLEPSCLLTLRDEFRAMLPGADS